MHSLKIHKYRQICHNTKIYSPKPLVEKKNSGSIRVTGELIKKKKKCPQKTKSAQFSLQNLNRILKNAISHTLITGTTPPSHIQKP